MSETKSKSINEKLSKIQKELKAPKGQLNKFGNYNYRSCEDILEAVKPLLNGLTLVITDEVRFVPYLKEMNERNTTINMGDDVRFYVRAIATLSDGENSISASAFAREAKSKKGMDEAQITGATSSYARKYALNGLFAIDDTKDADAQDNRPDTKPNTSVKRPDTKKKATPVKVEQPVTNTKPKPAGTPADTPSGKAAFEATGGQLICGCGREITSAVANFSERKYGKAICMVCQQKENKGDAVYENAYH